MRIVLAQSLTAQEMDEFIVAIADAKERIDKCGAQMGNAAITVAKKKYGDGCFEVKTIRGHQYLYRRYQQGGKLRSQYLGRAGSAAAAEKVKALGLVLPDQFSKSLKCDSP